MVAALIGEMSHVNGPSYWTWPWMDLGVARCLLALAPGLGLVGLGFLRLERGSTAGRRQALALFVAGALALQIGSWAAAGSPLEVGGGRVASPVVTGYYTDATEVGDVGVFLARFHQRPLHSHAWTHPPGPILFFVPAVRLLGAERGAVVGALLVALLASLVPLAVARLGRLWGAEPRAAATAAGLWAMLPGAALFSPELDQVYPLLAIALLLLGARLLEGDWRVGLGLGLVAAVALFFAYHLVLVGACLAGAWMLGIATAPDRRATVRRFVGALGWAVAGLLVVDGGLSAAFGYHPLASLGTALQHQATVAASWNRPWRLAVGWNLWDLLLGAGVVVSMLALLAVGRAARTRPATTGSRWTLLSLGTLLFVDLVGPMRGETARLWLFLQPLWVVPAGLELARRGPGVRVAALAGQAAVLVATLAKLGWIFVERPPA